MTAQELRRLRRVLGLTQVALARLVGISANSIARQERGEMGIKEPLARLIQLLAQTHASRRKPRRSR